MIRISLLACGLLCLSAVPAPAQSAADRTATDQAALNGEITSGRSDQGPGGLSARDVVGKRLLDAEGNMLGTIEKVSSDGRTAIVRSSGGSQVDEDMSRLSLGMGVHTVIKQAGVSRADALNAAEHTSGPSLPQPVSSGSSSTTTTTTYVPPPAITTTTTETSTTVRKP